VLNDQANTQQTHVSASKGTTPRPLRDSLAGEARVEAAIADLAMALIRSASVGDIASRVLENAQRLTNSPFGFVGYLDPETDHLVSLTLTDDIWDVCQVPGKKIVFEEPRGLWGWALQHRAPLLTNQPLDDPRSSGTPPGHIPIERLLCVPAMVGEDLVGLVALANAGHDYADADLALVERLASMYALAVQQMHREEALRSALARAQQREAEVTGLLDGARAVLKHRAFHDSARRIYDVCKALLGATAGYVSLLTEDGSENDVVFLDSGDLVCTVDPDLPMPIRGLRAQAYRTGEPVYDNNFVDSAWQVYLPAGHSRLDNVLFAPLSLAGEVVGLMGLSNKPGGFSDHDARLAAAFGELAAVALMNSRTLEALQRARDELEDRVATRTAELSIANELLLAEIAERTAAEAQLRASEERFRQLAEHVDEIFWVFELRAGRFLYISPRYAPIFGRPCQSLYDDAQSFLEAVHPEDRDRVAGAFRRVGEGYDVEYRIIRPDGSLRWIKARGFPVIDEKGAVYRVAGVAKDVTEEKQAQAALIRTERLAVAGKLAASLAHEVNNPLQSAVGCLELAQEAMAEGREAERYLQAVSDALLRTIRLVRQLLNLHRTSGSEERQRLDLRHAVEQVLLLVRKKCELHGIDIVWEAEEALPAIEFMPDAIHQVFLNLILNAIDAMDQGGILRVRMVRTDQPLGISTEIQDSGVGMPAASLGMAFDPFYSTKADGLGMGLFVSLSTVQAHGGDIDVQSREGEGSTFTVWLPAQG
jgi:PAS domain S-box-containing protein